MQNFEDTFETHKRSFISTFSVFMAVSLMYMVPSNHYDLDLSIFH